MPPAALSLLLRLSKQTNVQFGSELTSSSVSSSEFALGQKRTLQLNVDRSALCQQQTLAELGSNSNSVTFPSYSATFTYASMGGQEQTRFRSP